MIEEQPAVARVASHPGGPAYTTLHFDAALRITRANDDGLALFRVQSEAELIGRTPWELLPVTASSGIAATMREVQATRRTRIVTAPSTTRPGFDVWARCSPHHDGGVRLALRFTATRKGERRRRRDDIVKAAMTATHAIAALAWALA